MSVLEQGRSSRPVKADYSVSKGTEMIEIPKSGVKLRAAIRTLLGQGARPAQAPGQDSQLPPRYGFPKKNPQFLQKDLNEAPCR